MDVTHDGNLFSLWHGEKPMSAKEILAEIEKAIAEGKSINCTNEFLSEIIARVRRLEAALEFYADINNWKDTWKERGQESEHFKYFYQLRQRTDDFENLKPPQYHYYAGKRARKALEDE